MSDFLTDITDRVLTIRLNRPTKRNALTRAMYSGIAETLNAARSDDRVRVVLLAGSSQCFSAGNDLQDATIDRLDGDHGRFMRALMTFPKPVVAAPCGIAVGIGVTMLLHCDLVYCGEQTTFRLPFVQLAVCPEFGSSWLLPRLVGHQRASEILLGGEPFDAQAAHRFGIVNDILPNEQLDEFARAKAAFIASQPPAAVRTTKMLLKRANSSDVLEAIAMETEHLVTLQHGAEAGEAIAAFREKRRPDYSNFA